MRRFGETKLKILKMCIKPSTWTEMFKRLNLTSGGFHKHLSGLHEEGLLVKKEGKHVITEKGLEMLNIVENEREGKCMPKIEGIKLMDYFEGKFKRLLLHLDLTRYSVITGKTIITFGLYPLILLVENTMPDEEGSAYISFLAQVYCKAVDKKARKIDEELMANGKKPVMTETLWRLADENAWEKKDEVLKGYTLDFPTAFDDKFKEELRPTLSKAFSYATEEEINKAVFARLKVISHPITERWRVVKNIWK